MNNKKIGNDFEAEFAQTLYHRGFWVHVVASKVAGQPADIFAAKNGKAFLIDAKVCENDIFKLSRIEENQKNAMFLWEQCGNGQGWFALKLSDERVFMIDGNTLLLIRQDRKTINQSEIERLGLSVDVWERRCMS